MKYSLRSLMIAAILGPPLLATVWSVGAIAIARMRLRYEDQWDDVGGPGSVAEFTTNIECYLGEDENEDKPALPNSSAPAANPPKP